MRVVGSVERVGALSREEFERDFVQADRPVIISGSIEHWAARKTWSPEELRERIGSVPVRYKISSSHLHPDFEAEAGAPLLASEESTFAEFLDKLRGPDAAKCLLMGEDAQLMRVTPGEPREISSSFKPLMEDFEIPPYFSEDRINTVWSWFGSAGPRTWLHFDNNGCHNLNAQVCGSKRFWLFPPVSLEGLYPFGFDSGIPLPNVSQVNIESPDCARFPLFSEMECQEGEMREGDMLFLPAFWFHSFHHLGEFNANITFWWRPETLRLNPVSRRWAWLELLNRTLGDLAGSDGSTGGFDELPAEAKDILRRIDARACIDS
ncbi:cupin-like domain-containing protein [Streptomyces sp. NPDC047108]|uniref:cupin-like domain-containing protein n=1 Tax=Streptomyces sp. NPDC047108 TaxID=3155025 RepID=UPI00340AC7C8